MCDFLKYDHRYLGKLYITILLILLLGIVIKRKLKNKLCI